MMSGIQVHGKEKMGHLRWVLVGLLCLTGCQNVVGPFQCRRPERVDSPCLTIEEQQRRGRDRLALPEESPSVAPPSGLFLNQPYGR